MEIFLRCLPFHAIQSKHKQAWTKQCVTELRVYFSPILFKTHRISVVFAFPLPLARSLEFQVNPFQVDILHRFDSAAFRHASESKWVKHFTNARRCVRMTELPFIISNQKWYFSCVRRWLNHNFIVVWRPFRWRILERCRRQRRVIDLFIEIECSIGG